MFRSDHELRAGTDNPLPNQALAFVNATIADLRTREEDVVASRGTIPAPFYPGTPAYGTEERTIAVRISPIQRFGRGEPSPNMMVVTDLRQINSRDQPCFAGICMQSVTPSSLAGSTSVAVAVTGVAEIANHGEPVNAMEPVYMALPAVITGSDGKPHNKYQVRSHADHDRIRAVGVTIREMDWTTVEGLDALERKFNGDATALSVIGLFKAFIAGGYQCDDRANGLWTTVRGQVDLDGVRPAAGANELRFMFVSRMLAFRDRFLRSRFMGTSLKDSVSTIYLRIGC